MNSYLDGRNFPTGSDAEHQVLTTSLASILDTDGGTGMLPMLGGYGKTLRDTTQRAAWDVIYEKLLVLFKCGRPVALDGPMIGVPIAIRDTDYFRATARMFGMDRSAVAAIEVLATCWNATFAETGLWMGKTFEPVARDAVAVKCDNNPQVLASFSHETTRIGRNFFREPSEPNLLQSLGLPVLTRFWQLKDRPTTPSAIGFFGALLPENLAKETNIPYSMTGGIFLAQPGQSVVPEMRGKPVYQLNYRWPALEPAYPMTRLIDELVQIADGVYLGQLVMASQHYSLGTLRVTVPGQLPTTGEVGEPFHPADGAIDYGYQNNGFFLMIDPALAREAYADSAFSHLRPRPGEYGYRELGYDQQPAPGPAGQRRRSKVGNSASPQVADWVSGWRQDEALNRKFTTFCLEPSTKRSDGDVRELLREGESILQMLQRLQGEISAQSAHDDHLRHFEALNRLFRCGIAPRVVDGLFQGQGGGYNTRFTAPERCTWYGRDEPCTGFDYYHGATLNLHLGFGDTLQHRMSDAADEYSFFPSRLACLLQSDQRGPNVLNAVWAAIGRFIFPWAGKSFERISGRKLSMLLDESSDLAERYPERVAALRSHPASWPHYDLVKKHRDGYWSQQGAHAKHLSSGSWDHGMAAADQAFWEREANDHWVFGNNLQDVRILTADSMMRMLDMNYRPPLPSVQQLADAGPAPFVRQGYVFLGVADRASILPMNNEGTTTKRVFQFHYRYPLIGGPAPIGTCLDELVEIAEGLYLGQLIYSTDPLVPFHSSVDPADYKYQLFGYFLLLDNTWERHRQAIGFDVNT
jgi:hypothetical protein